MIDIKCDSATARQGENMNFGPTELIIILIIILLLFGSKKLPELARSLGESARELRKAMNDDDTPKKDDSSKKTS